MKKFRKLFPFIWKPILFVMLGCAIVYFAFAPVLQIAYAAADMMLADKAPDFNKETRDILNAVSPDKTGDSNDFTTSPQTSNGEDAENTISISEINYPIYGDLYATLTIGENTMDVYFGDDMAFLRKGVGQYLGSFIPGYGRPILISGHNRSYFKPLQNLKVGDPLIMTTAYGVYRYEITRIQPYTPTDPAAFDLSKQEEELILYTCYPFDAPIGRAPQRLFVYAKLVSGAKIVN